MKIPISLETEVRDGTSLIDFSECVWYIREPAKTPDTEISKVRFFSDFSLLRVIRVPGARLIFPSFEISRTFFPS